MCHRVPRGPSFWKAAEMTQQWGVGPEGSTVRFVWVAFKSTSHQLEQSVCQSPLLSELMVLLMIPISSLILLECTVWRVQNCKVHARF